MAEKDPREEAMFYVTSGLADPDKVALSERHEDHPDGEVFITGRRAQRVGDTPTVREHLRSGRLVRVEPDNPLMKTARHRGESAPLVPIDPQTGELQPERDVAAAADHVAEMHDELAKRVSEQAVGREQAIAQHGELSPEERVAPPSQSRSGARAKAAESGEH